MATNATLWCWTVRNRQGFAVGYGVTTFGSALDARKDLELDEGHYVDGGARLYVTKDKVDKSFRIGKSVR